MFKIITLFCIILLSSIVVVAQPERTIEVSIPVIPAMRELHHDYINNNQKLICQLDGINDSIFNVGKDERMNQLVNDALTAIVNNMQAKIELNKNITEGDKYYWLRGINEMLTDFISGYKSKNIKGALLYNIIKSYDTAMELQMKNESIKPLIENNEMEVGELLIQNLCLKNNISIPISKEILLLKKIKRYPNTTMSSLAQNPNAFYVDSIILSIAYHSPEQLYNYAAASDALGKKIQSINHPLVKKIGLLSLMKTGRMYFPFLDNLYQNKLSMDSITKLLYDTVGYYQLLVKTQIEYAIRVSKNDIPLVMNVLTAKLQSKAIELFINEINSLHDEKSENIRFKCLEKLSPQDLYYLIVLGEQEIYTSSYLGVYKRIFERMKTPSADTLLAWMHGDYYKKFIKIAANYNTLDDFLNRMDKNNVQQLMRSFVSGLEKTKTLEDAVDVANSYASIYNLKIQKLILDKIQENLAEAEKTESNRGQIVYNLLNIIFQSMDSSKHINLLARLGINEIYNMPISSLKDNTGRVIIQQFFYGDKDGQGIYNSFFQNYPSAYWRKIDSEKWVELRSIKGTPISIFSNKPFDNEADLDTKAQEELGNYLSENNLNPTIIIHRGHSYFVNNTIEQLPSSAKVILLGSCGGYQRLNEVLETCPDTHIIASKQTGAGVVNIALIVAITENLRIGKSLNWQVIWKNLEPKFKGATKEKFDDYVPPYKNLGAIFITAYKKAIQNN